MKINCGSGVHPLPGWVNVDLEAGPNVDVVADLGAGIPWPDASVDYIHSEDFLSCLPRIEQVRCFLSEARRVLRPSGCMRLLLPSLERLIEAWQQRPRWLVEHWQRAVGLPLDPPTGGHLVNLALKLNPGFFFDRATLEGLVDAAGFRLREVGYNESPHEALRGLDDRRPDQTVSVYYECDPI
nr:methyltransferase domain-containing protein [Lysobacter sp. CAU 1642]